MTDREMWDNATAVVKSEYEALAGSVRARLRPLLDILRREKAEIASIAERRGASDVCSGCGGACCRTGKYHFTTIDLLAFFDTDAVLMTPDFDAGSCPYLGRGGCLMVPSYRPLTCIIFHCERLEALLPPGDVERVHELERSLRGTCGEIEKLFRRRLTQGLLLSYERSLERGDCGILAEGKE